MEGLRRIVGGSQALHDLDHSRQRVCPYHRGIQGELCEALA